MACYVISCRKIAKTLFRKSLISLYDLGSWVLTSEITKKWITQSWFAQIFAYIWHILSATWWIPLSRRFRICMAKGGRESLRPSYGRSKLILISIKKSPYAVLRKSWAVTILTLEQNPPERKFLTYIKIFSQEDFALKSKLWPLGFS